VTLADLGLVAFFRWTWLGAVELKVSSLEVREHLLVLKRSPCLLGKTLALMCKQRGSSCNKITQVTCLHDGILIILRAS